MFSSSSSSSPSLLLRFQSSVGDVPAVAASAESGKQIEELHELMRFLRREKEIVEAKHDAARQEAARLKQQLVRGERDEEENMIAYYLFISRKLLSVR
jgi:hypothetical protein